MHNNYYFLKKLAEQLNQILAGYSIVSCFSQNKDELILEFNNGVNSFFIKATLSPAISCLSFPGAFQRSRKNNVDLFPKVILKKITHVYVFDNERSLAIALDEDFTIIFKMHGNRANVLLAQCDNVIGLFRNQLQADASIRPSFLHRRIDFSRRAFELHQSNLEQTYFTFGKPVWQYLRDKGFASGNDDTRWQLFEQTLQLLEHPTYYLSATGEHVQLLIVPSANVIETYTEPVLAVNDFFHRFARAEALEKEKTAAMQKLTARLQSCDNYLAKNRSKLLEIQHDQHYHQWADVLMANLHHISPGVTTVTLENFYDNNRLITIKLKPELTAQKNAEIFYRKSKNQQIEIEKLKEGISKKEKEQHRIQTTLAELQSVTDLKSLRALPVVGEPKATDERKRSLPFHEFEYKGFKIWVGKDAQRNDELTLKHAYKEDLWLHAKDVAGSHVIIKYQAGKPFPKDVIERAAQLAAYNSKRRTETLCPVIVTPKKFVRKRKGDAAGAVVVEREEVMLVEPRL